MKTDWIQTYTGKQFYPLEPRVDDICIEDIAHALSMICRFTGHCSHFYSVAQHSVYVAERCPSVTRFAGLMHDAAEAYLADVSKPVKPYLMGFRDIEDKILEKIYDRFKIKTTLEEEEVMKLVDERMCFTEGMKLMPDVSNWQFRRQPFVMDITPMDPKLAESFFLNAFDEWGNQ